MKVAAPIEEFDGFDSVLCAHFGSAPAFALVDVDAGTVTPLGNTHAAHDHGSCQAMKKLGGHPIDAVLVGGIGQGALLGLKAAGIRVWSTTARTLRDALAQWQDQLLTEADLNQACPGHAHDHGHGCGHS